MKSRAVGLSGNVWQSQMVQMVQRRWPFAAVVAGAVLVGASIVVRRRQQR